MDDLTNPNFLLVKNISASSKKKKIYTKDHSNFSATALTEDTKYNDSEEVLNANISSSSKKVTFSSESPHSQ